MRIANKQCTQIVTTWTKCAKKILESIEKRAHNMRDWLFCCTFWSIVLQIGHFITETTVIHLKFISIQFGSGTDRIEGNVKYFFKFWNKIKIQKVKSISLSTSNVWSGHWHHFKNDISCSNFHHWKSNKQNQST